MTLKGAAFLIVFFLGTVVGNLLFKQTALGLAPMTFSLETLRDAVTRPSLYLAVFFYMGAAIAWFVALSMVPLNIAISVSALVYVAVIMVAVVVFGEAIPMVRWMGIALTATGFAVIAWTS